MLTSTAGFPIQAGPIIAVSSWLTRPSIYNASDHDEVVCQESQHTLVEIRNPEDPLNLCQKLFS